MSDTPTPSELPVASASAPADPASPEKAADKTTQRLAIAGAAVGIGSAAIVAALLFVNRGKSDKPPHGR